MAGLRGLDHRISALAELKAATLVQCEYCIDLGSCISRQRGLSDDELLALPTYRTSPLFSEKDRLVLDYAARMSRTPAVVPRRAVRRAATPVILINAFTVPSEESERFLLRWRESAQILSGRPGLIRARMHRALDNDCELRFVNVAEWQSRNALDEATASPEFRASVRRLQNDPGLHITARPAVYRVVVELGPGRLDDVP